MRLKPRPRNVDHVPYQATRDRRFFLSLTRYGYPLFLRLHHLHPCSGICARIVYCMGEKGLHSISAFAPDRRGDLRVDFHVLSTLSTKSTTATSTVLSLNGSHLYTAGTNIGRGNGPVQERAGNAIIRARAFCLMAPAMPGTSTTPDSHRIW